MNIVFPHFITTKGYDASILEDNKNIDWNSIEFFMDLFKEALKIKSPNAIVYKSFLDDIANSIIRESLGKE